MPSIISDSKTTTIWLKELIPDQKPRSRQDNGKSPLAVISQRLIYTVRQLQHSSPTSLRLAYTLSHFPLQSSIPFSRRQASVADKQRLSHREASRHVQMAAHLIPREANKRKQGKQASKKCFGSVPGARRRQCYLNVIKRRAPIMCAQPDAGLREFDAVGRQRWVCAARPLYCNKVPSMPASCLLKTFGQ